MPHEVATQKTEWSFSRPVLSLDGDFLALAALLANRKQMPAGVADGGGQRRLVIGGMMSGHFAPFDVSFSTEYCDPFAAQPRC